MSNNLYPANLFATNTEDEPRTEDNITNPYFNFYNESTTQDLIRQMTAESIQKNGMEFVYIRRSLVNLDDILGEDMENIFTEGYKFAGYLENVEGFSGTQEFYSKFGLQINDTIKVVVEPMLFHHQVDGADPIEGDLVYWPMTKTLFEITWNEEKSPFFPNGVAARYTLECHKFIYSGESMEVTNQGTIDVVDNVPFTEINQINGKADSTNPEYKEADSTEVSGDALKSDIDESNPFGIDI